MLRTCRDSRVLWPFSSPVADSATRRGRRSRRGRRLLASYNALKGWAAADRSVLTTTSSATATAASAPEQRASGFELRCPEVQLQLGAFGAGRGWHRAGSGRCSIRCVLLWRLELLTLAQPPPRRRTADPESEVGLLVRHAPCVASATSRGPLARGWQLTRFEDLLPGFVATRPTGTGGPGPGAGSREPVIPAPPMPPLQPAGCRPHPAFFTTRSSSS